MKRWPIRPLGELCDVRIGRTPRRDEPRFWGGDAVWVTIRELNGGEITSSKEMVSEAAVQECMPDPVPVGTLLFSFKLSIGKMAVAGCPLYTNEAIAALPIRDPSKLSRDFLRYALLAESHEGTANMAVLGKVLNKEKVQQLPISVPPLAEQERIVTLLDEADELRELRAQADRRTAALIPSLFHEMFGPDAPGSAIWQNATVAEIAAPHEGSIRTGPFGSDLRHSEFVESGVPVLGIDNVVENEFRWAKSRCIPEAKFAEMKRFVVFPGDVLVTIMGTVGRCSIAPEGLPVCISTKHLCAVTLDRTKVHPRFIWGAFLHDASIKQQTRLVGKGAIMEGWNSTIIKRLRLRVPPLPLQKEFAARVSEICAMQAEQTTSRRRLDDLFQSLLHRAFRGEL